MQLRLSKSEERADGRGRGKSALARNCGAPISVPSTLAKNIPFGEIILIYAVPGAARKMGVGRTGASLPSIAAPLA